MKPLEEILLLHAFDYLATFLWAISGAVVGLHKRYDFTGVLIVAAVASTGGSLLRDGLFLNRTPPLLTDRLYVPLILLSTVIVSLFRRRIINMQLIDLTISTIDALGIPVFAIVGMELALRYQIPLPGVLLVGVVNGIGGGLLRDLLVGDTPTALAPGRLLISALLIVSVPYLVAYQLLNVPQPYVGWAMIALYFVIRVASIRYDLRTHPVLRDLP